MLVKEASVGDVLISSDGRWSLREYRHNLSKEELYEASKNGFRVGYLQYFRGGGEEEAMVYMGPIRTNKMICGLWKHHLFLTPTGTFSLHGYEFRHLTKV